MKIVGPPVCGCRLVESPPMSQRSHMASSGSTAICECSAACSAPSSWSSGSAVERDEVERLVVRQPLALIGEHLLGDDHHAERERHSEHLAPVEQALDVGV